MTNRPLQDPSTCTSMAELRAGIDALDAELVALLAHRARFIDRASQIKAAKGLPANIPTRVEEVVANVRAQAKDAELCPDLAEEIWRALIAWSIAREEKTLGPSDGAGSTDGERP